MRANSSVSSLVVVVLALVGGCSPAEGPAVVAVFPEPPAPDPMPTPDPVPAPSQATPDDLLRQVEQIPTGQSQTPINGIGGPVFEGPGQPSNELSANTLSPPVRRWFFQCTDDVSFAVRGAGSRLEVFPPGHSHGYIVLMEQPSDAGLYYTAPGAELRMSDDLATLQVGRDRYVDCVSNPAAAVWQDPLRGGTPAR